MRAGNSISRVVGVLSEKLTVSAPCGPAVLKEPRETVRGQSRLKSRNTGIGDGWSSGDDQLGRERAESWKGRLCGSCSRSSGESLGGMICTVQHSDWRLNVK